MDPVVSEWMKDPEFNALPTDERRGIIRGYFAESTAGDQEYNSLPWNERQEIERNFINDHAAERTLLDYPRDVAVSVGRGVVDLGQAAVGVGDLQTFGAVGKALENIGYDTKTTQDFFESLHSDAQQQANRAVEQAQGFTGTVKSMVQHPSTIGMGVARTVPSMLGGAAIGRGLVGKAAPILGGAIGEGVIGAGMSAEEMRQQTETGLIGPKQVGAATLSGVGTSIISVIGGRFAKKLGATDVDTLLAGGKFATNEAGIIKRIIGGGFSEGVLEELPQSIQEQIFMNAAMDRPLMQGVPESAAQGLVIGAAAGGGANIPATRAQAPEIEPPPIVDKEAPRSNVLASLENDLYEGRIAPESLAALSGRLQEEFGIEPTEITDLVSSYKESQAAPAETLDMDAAPTFQGKVEIAQAQVDHDTALEPVAQKNILQQARERNQRLIEAQDLERTQEDSELRQRILGERAEAVELIKPEVKGTEVAQAEVQKLKREALADKIRKRRSEEMVAQTPVSATEAAQRLKESGRLYKQPTAPELSPVDRARYEKIIAESQKAPAPIKREAPPKEELKRVGTLGEITEKPSGVKEAAVQKPLAVEKPVDLVAKKVAPTDIKAPPIEKRSPKLDTKKIWPKVAKEATEAKLKELPEVDRRKRVSTPEETKSFNEAIGRTVKKITSERGSISLKKIDPKTHEDLKAIARHIYKQTGAKFVQFRDQMSKALSGVWDKVKGLTLGLYREASKVSKDERGSISSKKVDSKKIAKEAVPEKEAKKAPTIDDKISEAVSDPESEKVMKKLRRLYTSKGVISPAKTKKLISGYGKLTKDLKDAQTDIHKKQAALEKHIKETLPTAERFRVMHHIKKIAKAKTEETRAKYLEAAMVATEDAHQRMEKRDYFKRIEKLIKKKKPSATKRGVKGHKGMEEDAHKLFKIAEKAMGMTKEEFEVRQYEMFLAIDQAGRAPTIEEITENSLNSVFSNLKNKSAEEIKRAYEILVQINRDGRLALAAAEAIRKERLGKMVDIAGEELSGVKGMSRQDIIEKKQTLTEKQDAERKFVGKMVKNLGEGIKTFDDMSQSWEFMLDKLSRRHKETGTLEGETTKYFSELVHTASNQESAGVAKYENLFFDKVKEIYGKKNVAKRLLKNTEVKSKTGVHRYKGRTKVEKPLSQNTAYKLWQMFQQPSIQEEMEHHGYTDKTLVELEKFIKPDVMKWAKWQIDEFYPSYKDGINDVYKKLFYVDMDFIEGYNPISRRYKGQTEDQALLGEGSIMTSALPSGTKQRVKNMRDFNILDGDSVLLMHVTQMEHFKAWGLPMQEMRSVLGRESIQDIIELYHGKKANKVLETYMNQFAAGGIDRKNILQWADKRRSNFIKYALGLNIGLLPKQLMSVFAYAAAIPVKDFTHGMAEFYIHPVKNFKTLMSSDWMKERYKVGHERDIAHALRKSNMQRLTGKKGITDSLLFPTKAGDLIAVIAGGWAVYSYHLKKEKKAGASDADAHKRALLKFEMVSDRSQQSARMQSLSYLQNMGSLAKLFTMFMTAQASYYRNLAAGYRNLLAGRGSKAENLKRIMIYQFILPAAFQAMVSALSPGEWDEDDNNAMIRALLTGPLNGLFIARDLVEGVLTAAIEGKIYRSLGMSPPFSIIGMAARSGRVLYKAGEDGWDDDLFWELIDEVSDFAGAYSGVPTRQIKKMAKGVEAGLE